MKYCLKYFKGIDYTIIDPKSIKDQAYLSNVIKIL
jgi:hypothetical protein